MDHKPSLLSAMTASLRLSFHTMSRQSCNIRKPGMVWNDSCRHAISAGRKDGWSCYSYKGKRCGRKCRQQHLQNLLAVQAHKVTPTHPLPSGRWLAESLAISLCLAVIKRPAPVPTSSWAPHLPLLHVSYYSHHCNKVGTVRHIRQTTWRLWPEAATKGFTRGAVSLIAGAGC